MNSTLWRQLHSASTYSPIVSLPASLGVCVVGVGLTAVSLIGAGYSGGQQPLAADNTNVATVTPSAQPGSRSDGTAPTVSGQKLFLKNCAHCHGADAHGDEGPDLHNLDWSDEQIATRIRNGKKGQMTAFAARLSPQEIEQIIAYLRTLK